MKHILLNGDYLFPVHPNIYFLPPIHPTISFLQSILGGTFTEAEQLVEHIHNYLSVKRKEMDEGKIAPELYIITKALSKMPHEYADAKSQPHVEVASRMIREMNKVVNPGLEIP